MGRKDLLLIVLVALVFFLVGRLSFEQKTSPAPTGFMPADDGKLAKEYNDQNLVKFVRGNAKNLQSCYLDTLARKLPVIEGDVKVLVRVEEDGIVSSVRITENQFQDETMAKCLIEKIEGQYFAPPPLGINRYLSHTLSFKTEETAKREAQERAQDRMPKVLPVSAQ